MNEIAQWIIFIPSGNPHDAAHPVVSAICTAAAWCLVAAIVVSIIREARR